MIKTCNKLLNKNRLISKTLKKINRNPAPLPYINYSRYDIYLMMNIPTLILYSMNYKVQTIDYKP